MMIVADVALTVVMIAVDVAFKSSDKEKRGCKKKMENRKETKMYHRSEDTSMI